MNSVIAELNTAVHDIGEIPAANLQEILKYARRCFTCSENPYKQTPANNEFQRTLETRLDADPEYRHTPSLGRYLYHVTMLIAEWERDNQQHQIRTVEAPAI